MIRLIEGALLHRCTSGFFNSYISRKTSTAFTGCGSGLDQIY